MARRVLIATAGTGSRLGSLTKHLNKSLISVGNKPVISHIIEKFDGDIEFVIALGYKGELVKEFLSLAYPKYKFIYVEVYPFKGAGSGLGLSLLQCKQHLQQPFIFCSCDTIIEGKIPELKCNWMGYADRQEVHQYRTITMESQRVTSINEKGLDNLNEAKPYIGLAGIWDYEEFWKAMESNKTEAIDIGEAYGLKNLVQKEIQGIYFDWYDTGNIEELTRTRQKLTPKHSPNILEKENETIWFLNNLVIKYSDDVSFIQDRVERAKLMDGYIPKLLGHCKHMYSYKYAHGEVMSKAVNAINFKKLLEFSQKFWEKKYLDQNEKMQFEQRCMEFYKTKTLERIELFYKKFSKSDKNEKINGQVMPTLQELICKVDWDSLACGEPVRFHGDYHFENILFNEQDDNFVFLDWRQNFGGSLLIGDLYYDFAKLLHGLIICHELIAKDDYFVKWCDNEITYDFLRKQALVDCEKIFFRWIDENGYDSKKVTLLTALVYLNIAGLHHHPYGLLLYALGKKMLYDVLL